MKKSGNILAIGLSQLLIPIKPYVTIHTFDAIFANNSHLIFNRNCI